MKRGCQHKNIEKADVPLATLDASYVGPMEAGDVGQSLLAETPPFAKDSECKTECLQFRLRFFLRQLVLVGPPFVTFAIVTLLMTMGRPTMSGRARCERG